MILQSISNLFKNTDPKVSIYKETVRDRVKKLDKTKKRARKIAKKN